MNSFIHIWEGHYKVWSYELSGKDISFYWGRIGKTQSTLTKTFRTEYEAEKFILTKVQEKLNKGYVNITKPQLMELVI